MLPKSEDQLPNALDGQYEGENNRKPFMPFRHSLFCMGHVFPLSEIGIGHHHDFLKAPSVITQATGRAADLRYEISN